jgi:hypothetical protein
LLIYKREQQLLLRELCIYSSKLFLQICDTALDMSDLKLLLLFDLSHFLGKIHHLLVGTGAQLRQLPCG